MDLGTDSYLDAGLPGADGCAEDSAQDRSAISERVSAARDDRYRRRRRILDGQPGRLHLRGGPGDPFLVRSRPIRPTRSKRAAGRRNLRSRLAALFRSNAEVAKGPDVRPAFHRYRRDQLCKHRIQGPRIRQSPLYSIVECASLIVTVIWK